MKTLKLLKIGFIGNPLDELNLNPDTPSFDSTWQLMEYGEKHAKDGLNVRYIPDRSVEYRNGKIWGTSYQITNLKEKIKLIHGKKEELETFDALIIRKDPPFDTTYLVLVQLLMQIQGKTQIINSPKALAQFNEKINILIFPEYAPASLVSRNTIEIKEFIAKQKNGVVVKGLDNKGGSNIFKLTKNDPNINEILTQITKEETVYIMCQEYLNIEKTGDKRITVIDGQVVGGFLRRPGKGDFRGNINKGATAEIAIISGKEKAMAEKIATYFLRHNVGIIGIDVIEGKCTEINITSPLLSKKFMPEVEKIFYDYVRKQCSKQ